MKASRSVLAFWAAMEQTFGRYPWAAVHGVEPSQPWIKLVASFDEKVRSRVLRTIQERRARGELPALPNLESLEALFVEEVQADSVRAQKFREEFWRGAVIGHMNSAASVLGLVPPKGTIADLPQQYFTEAKSCCVEYTAVAVELVAAGKLSADVDRVISRAANQLMQKITRKIDAAFFSDAIAGDHEG